MSNNEARGNLLSPLELIGALAPDRTIEGSPAALQPAAPRKYRIRGSKALARVIDPDDFVLLVGKTIELG